MKLKEILIGAAAVVLVALVAVGATLAYLTATDEVTNVMTVGDVDIELLEYERVDAKTKGDEAAVQEFVDDKLLMPPMLADGFDYASPDATIKWDEDKDGNAIKPGYTSNIWDPEKISRVGDKMVFVKSTSSHTDAYVRLYFAFEAGNYATLEQFQNKIHLNINEVEWTWMWETRLAEIKGMKCFVACATYNKPISPDEITAISLSQIALDPTATNGDAIAFGDKYDILVVGQAIQSGAFADAKQALDEGFGTEPPFRGIEYVDYTTLKAALHNLNGNTANPITANVNSVTFGLFEDYYEEVIGHEGVATTNASGDGEFAGYTYYVPNGDKYDLYVLTDSGVIYKLFADMSSLTKVDTANLDVSKTTDMNRMFCNCSALAEIDVSNWNVSNVGSMERLFQGCAKLGGLAVANWDVGNVTNMNYIFDGCAALTSDKFNVSGWNVSKVSNFGGMFNRCALLTTLDLSAWKTDSAKIMYEVFQYCRSLTTVKISDWDVSKVTTMNHMFNACDALQIIDISGWDTPRLESTIFMFANCDTLTTIYVGDGWNVDKVASSKNMFHNSGLLVGGSGTRYNSANVEKDYAIIDGGASNPGYLTQGPAPANP